jgi:large subunit ribosomal protein L24e
MKCSYCGKKITVGKGKMFVRTDGTIILWCSSKCEKSYKMGREAKKRKWSRK